LENTDTQPKIGWKVEVFLDDDVTLLFRGSVDSIVGEGICEGSTTRWVELDCLGYDSRLYQRYTRNAATGDIAHYRSLSGHATITAGEGAWVDGSVYDVALVGKAVLIEGVSRVVSAVADPLHFTLADAVNVTAGTFVYNVYSGDAVKDLINTYANAEGFTTSGVGDISNGAVLDEELFYPPSTVYDAITRIVGLNEGYMFRARPDQSIYFGPYVSVSAPFNFNSTAIQKREIKVTTSREDVQNVQLAQVMLDDIGITEKIFTADGTARSWFLDSKMGQFSKMELNGVEVSAGDEESSSDYLYDLNTKAIWLAAATVTLGSGDQLKVMYYPVGVDITEAADSVAIEARRTIETTGSGRYEKFKDRTTQGLVSGYNSAVNDVSLLKDDLVKITLNTFLNGLYPGMTCSVAIAGWPDISGVYYIDAVSASSSEFAGSPYELEYTVTLIDATRRVQDVEIIRQWGKQGKNQMGNPTATTGSGGTSGSLPSGLTFTPAIGEYGEIKVENVNVAIPNGITGIDFYLVYIDETTIDCWAELNAGIDSTTDPVTIDATINPDKTSTISFGAGDWIMFGTPGSYEWAQITTGWIIQRHYPGTDAGEATFESMMAAHATGCHIFKGQVARFLFNAQTGGFADGQVPTEFNLKIPGVVVGAIVAAPYNDNGYGDWVVYNCAQASVPGIRTLCGGNYTFQKAGTMVAAAGVNCSISKSVQFAEPLRTAFAYVSTAPTGDDVIITLRKSADGTTWITLSTLTITAGALFSYDPGYPPADRREPYDGTWPWIPLLPGEFLNWVTTQVGSTVAGEDVTVEVYT